MSQEDAITVNWLREAKDAERQYQLAARGAMHLGLPDMQREKVYKGDCAPRTPVDDFAGSISPRVTSSGHRLNIEASVVDGRGAEVDEAAHDWVGVPSTEADRAGACMTELPDFNAPYIEMPTDEINAERSVKLMLSVAKRIADRDEEPIQALVRVHAATHRLTPLGRAVSTLVASRRYVDSHYAGYIFHPYITVMQRALARYGPRLFELAQVGRTSPTDHEIRRGIGGIVRMVRRVSRHATFRRQLHNFERNEIKNRTSYRTYAASWFARSSRNLVLRVDLYYQPDWKGWADTEQATLGWKRFVRALRRGKIVPDLVGWMAKRERGLRRGVHYHVLVALNGHKHRSAIAWADRLGSYWVEECTGRDRLGTYFNCYYRAKWFEYNGLGLLRRDDGRGMVGLGVAIDYLTKADSVLKTGRSRNLWRGIMQKTHCR